MELRNIFSLTFKSLYFFFPADIFFSFFHLLNSAAPAVLRRQRPCIFSLCMCQEQDSGEQGEGRKGLGVWEAIYWARVH